MKIWDLPATEQPTAGRADELEKDPRHVGQIGAPPAKPSGSAFPHGSGAPVEAPEPPPPPTPAGSQLVGLALEDFLAQSPAGVPWFVDGVMVEGGLIAGVGRPETFKTQAAIHLGLAAAGGASSWLGLKLGPVRPFLYVTNEKAAATVREKFRRMTAVLHPTEPIRVAHRARLMFGDRARWAELSASVKELGPRTFVVLDTVASLAGPGFDENSGKDMAVVLSAVRQLCDAGSTVLLLHHPSKHGEGTGGIRLRGHTSLWGEVDAVLEFTRPSRESPTGVIRMEPKDGDFRLVQFAWDPRTFLLQAALRALSAPAVAEVGEALYFGTPVAATSIEAEFPTRRRSAVREQVAKALEDGLIERVCRGPSTRYVPVQRLDDERHHESPERPDDGRTISSAEREPTGRLLDDDMEAGIVHGRGSIGPRPDDPPPVQEEAIDHRASSAIDCRDYLAHRSKHRKVDGRWTCDECDNVSVP